MKPIPTHRTVVSDQTPQMRETPIERATSVLASTALMLALLSSFLIAVWLMFGEVQRAPRPTGIDRISDRHGTEMAESSRLATAALFVEMPHDQPAASLEIETRINSLVAGISAVAASRVDFPLPGESTSDPQGTGPGDGIEEGQSNLRRQRKQSGRHWTFDMAPLRGSRAYVRLVTQLGLQPAAVFPDGRVVYLPQDPTTSKAHTGQIADENRFYAQWQQGNLQNLLIQRCQDAGVDPETAVFVHFFSPALMASLEALECDFAGRTAGEIRRTRFRIAESGASFEVTVTRQVGIDGR